MIFLSWKNWTHNLSAKILAFVVATAVWLMVTNGQEFETDIVFPIEYVNRPEGLSSLETMPTSASTHVRGRGKFLRYTTRGGVCRVDLAGTQVGRNTLLLDGSNVSLPDDAGVSRVEVRDPRRIVVEFDETIVRDIPITPTISGRPDPRYVQVGKTFLNPAEARVMGPRRLVDEIALLSTLPIDVDGHRSTIRREVRLTRGASPTIEITPETVEVGITIEPLLDEIIEGMALEFGGRVPDGLNASVRPASIAVGIRGARSIVEVAAREIAALTLVATEWTEGITILRLKEIRGRELVFAPHETFPLVSSPPWGGDGPVDPEPDNGPDLPPSGKVSAAVRGEVVATLPLPRDVEILSVEPDRLAIVIRSAPVDPSGVSGNGGTGGSGGRAPGRAR